MPILTEEELETCWYCGDCDKPMREDDDGYLHNENCYCSEECAENYDAKQ